MASTTTDTTTPAVAPTESTTQSVAAPEGAAQTSTTGPETPTKPKKLDSFIENKIKKEYEAKLREEQRRAKELEEKYNKLAGIKDINAFARHYGYSAEDLTNQLMNSQQPVEDATTILQKKINALEEERSQEKKALEQQQLKAQQQQFLSNIHAEMVKILKDDATIFPIIEGLGLSDILFQSVVAELQQSNFSKPVDVLAKARKAVKDLEENYKVMDRLFKPKVPEAGSATQPSVTAPQAPQQPFTLSNGQVTPSAQTATKLTGRDLLAQRVREYEDLMNKTQ